MSVSNIFTEIVGVLNIPDNVAQQTMDHKTLRVTVILVSIKHQLIFSSCEPFQDDPFVMLKQSESPLLGNDRYEGYCIDMLDEIARIRKFNYTIMEVKDGAYGSMENNQWNGMVGELVRGVRRWMNNYGKYIRNIGSRSRSSIIDNHIPAIRSNRFHSSIYAHGHFYSIQETY